MISPTQTMENTTEVEYISIYDKPKRGRGRPKTCKLSDEEKRQRKTEIAKRYYENNFEYVRLQKRIWLDKKYEQRTQIV
jgi:hypothetical protein